MMNKMKCPNFTERRLIMLLGNSHFNPWWDRRRLEWAIKLSILADFEGQILSQYSDHDEFTLYPIEQPIYLSKCDDISHMGINFLSQKFKNNKQYGWQITQWFKFKAWTKFPKVKPKVAYPLRISWDYWTARLLLTSRAPCSTCARLRCWLCSGKTPRNYRTWATLAAVEGQISCLPTDECHSDSSTT